MRESTVAKVYADALLQLASENNKTEEVGEELGVFVSLLVRDNAVKVFFESPQVNTIDKKTAIEKSLKGKISDLMLHFLLVVVEKNRQLLFRAMLEQYRDLLDKMHNRIHVSVRTAVALNSDIESKLRMILSDLRKREVILHHKVEPGILGGIVVKVGDMFLDGSVRTRLKNLRESLLSSEIRSEKVYEDTT